MDEREFRLEDLVGMFRRRWRMLVAVAGGISLLAVLIAAILPNRFVAATTLLVEPQSVSKRLVDDGKADEDLMNRLHLLTMQILSRARLSRIIDDLGLYAEMSEEKTREEVIEYMRNQIWIEPVLPELGTGRPKSAEVVINTFRIYFGHEKRQTAAAVANRLANDFIDEHIRDRVRSSGDTAEFIEAELARLSTRTQEVEAQIARIKGENPGSLPEDMLSNQSRLERTHEVLRQAQQRLGDAKSDITFYQQQARVARQVEGGRGDVVGRAVTPALRLRELEIQLGALRARGLTDKHPDIVIAEAEAADIREQIDGDGSEDAPPTSMAEQQAAAEAERARQRAEAAEAELVRLREEIAATEARLAATPRVAEQLDALQREWMSLNESYQSFSAKRLEANVTANMERRQKGEQFRVLEPAFAPPHPSSPNRVLIIAVGALLGLFAGAGLVFALEMADSSYHVARAVQESLRVPVLAAIPAILLDADRRARRRRQMREAFAAAAVTATVLMVSAAGYVYVNMPGLFSGGNEPAASAPETRPAAPAPTAASPETAPSAGSASPPPAGG